MDSTIIAALIGLAGSAIGSCVGVLASATLTLSDLDARIRDCQRDLVVAECAADDLLQAIAGSSVVFGPRDAAVLRLRYREDLPWADVREGLAKCGYSASERTVRYWHDAAIRRANAVIRTEA